MMRTYASRSQTSFLQTSQFWQELALKTMLRCSGRILGEDLLVAPVLLAVLHLAGRGHPLDAGVPHQVEGLFLREPAQVVRQHEDTRDVVMDTADDRAAETRGEDVLLHGNEDGCLGPGLFGLRHVHVHLIAIEVGVVGRADGRVEPERPAFHHLDAVGHDAHPVQRGLTVEEHHIVVAELAFDRVAGLDHVGDRVEVVGTQAGACGCRAGSRSSRRTGS